MEENDILIENNNVLGNNENSNCGCDCISSVCSKKDGDCNNIIPFANLLTLPANFCPCTTSDWQNLKISVKPYLNCVLEQCVIKNAHLVFTDPCNKSHDIQKYYANVKKARVLGTIEYIISAQSSVSDITGDTASVSDFYAIHVDRVVEFIDDCNIKQASVIVNYQDLGFDNPPEFLYGNNHALKIKGEFTLSLGYITNGSFENNFVGWTNTIPSGATAETVTHFDTYDPIDRCYFALLKTDGQGTYNTIKQDFYAAVGDKISGWSFFKSNDYMPFNDRCEVDIKSGNTILETVFRASVSTVGDYGKTPWTYWEYTFTAAGLYTIDAMITNGGDSILDSYMGLDAIKLTLA